MPFPRVPSPAVVAMAFAAIALAPQAQADPSGDALGAKVAAAVGDVYAPSVLSFTFVVEAGGTEKARRTHTFDRTAGTLTVQTGTEVVRLSGLHSTDPSAAVSEPDAHGDVWRAIAPDAAPADAARAWSAWINDSYWLLAPGKVMDAGVRRTVDAEGRLVLTFDGVGVTPGDQYALQIDPTSHQVLAWDFTLQSGRKGHFDWTDHRPVGPLTLSHHRATEAGDFVIRFEDVSIQP